MSVLQGSLSDLRMEVATAQNLSTSAGAAVADSASQQQRHHPSALARTTAAAAANEGAPARPSSAPRTASYPSTSAGAAGGGGGASILRPTSGMALPTMRAAVPIRNTTREAFAEPSYLSGSSSMFSSPSATRTASSVQPRSMLEGTKGLIWPSRSLFSAHLQTLRSCPGRPPTPPQHFCLFYLCALTIFTPYPTVEASIAHSVSEVSRVLDTKMSDFERRLDRQIGKAAVIVAANAATTSGSQGSGLQSAAPSSWAQPQQQQQQQYPQQQYQQQPQQYQQQQATYASSAAPSAAAAAFPVASESLVFLTISKADAAEKATTELRAELAVSTGVECACEDPYLCFEPLRLL